MSTDEAYQTQARNIMAFFDFFQEDDSGDWRQQLEEIRLRYPGTYTDYEKEKAVLPPTRRTRTAREIQDRQIAKYNKAVIAYEEWQSLHPKGAILTSEDEARGDALERAIERAEPEECSDCGTYCGGNCPCNPEPPMEWLREQQYRAILAQVERWAGVVTFADRLRASLSVGSYRYENTDAIILALLELAAKERVVISADPDGITVTNERGHGWGLMALDFVDRGKAVVSGVATFEDDFLAEIRGDESTAAVELD